MQKRNVRDHAIIYSLGKELFKLLKETHEKDKLLKNQCDLICVLVTRLYKMHNSLIKLRNKIKNYLEDKSKVITYTDGDTNSSHVEDTASDVTLTNDINYQKEILKEEERAIKEPTIMVNEETQVDAGPKMLFNKAEEEPKTVVNEGRNAREPKTTDEEKKCACEKLKTLVNDERKAHEEQETFDKEEKVKENPKSLVIEDYSKTSEEWKDFVNKWEIETCSIESRMKRLLIELKHRKQQNKNVV